MRMGECEWENENIKEREWENESGLRNQRLFTSLELFCEFVSFTAGVE